MTLEAGSAHPRQKPLVLGFPSQLDTHISFPKTRVAQAPSGQVWGSHRFWLLGLNDLCGCFWEKQDPQGPRQVEGALSWFTTEILLSRDSARPLHRLPALLLRLPVKAARTKAELGGQMARVASLGSTENAGDTQTPAGSSNPAAPAKHPVSIL